MHVTTILRASRSAFVALFAALLAGACTTRAPRHEEEHLLAAPRAPKDPTIRDVHGERFVDDYAWLKDRDDPRTTMYLEAENTFAQRAMAHTAELQGKLYKEMLGRVKEDDTSAPYRKGEYWYYSRTEKGKPYEIHCRKHRTLDAPEEIILDENALGAGKDYFATGIVDVSEDHRILAYSTDELGNERYALRFKDLTTGEPIGEVVLDTYTSSAWANDNKTLFYTKIDTASRPFQLWRHTLGTPAASDVLVYEERDERFRLDVGRARQGRFILVSLGSNASDEWWFIDADDPAAPPRVIGERREKVEYSVDVGPDRFFIITNDQHVNFRLAEAPIEAPGWPNWRTLVGGRDEVTIEGQMAFARHLVIFERDRGLEQIRVRRYADKSDHAITFSDDAYTVSRGPNEEFTSELLRFEYESPITPPSVIDYHMESRTRTIVKRLEVPAYNPDDYTVQRLMAPAPDGKLVPITLARRKDRPLGTGGPALLEGYGSYGYSSDPYFDSNIFSLLDRGFVYAIAHIRGGSDMGRAWYEDGRLRNKMNTFTDFIACAEHLQREGHTTPHELAILGGSAGGLLMGAVTNMRPELFGAVVSLVPFVDVINTMLDPTIPLTVTEWEQWGNPNDAGDYAYMRAYSPYDNLKAADYPPMLVRAGLNDPRVGYWEPAKYVARLRELTSAREDLLFVTNMGAGHGGASDRYEHLREWAYNYAFVIQQVGGAGR